MRTIIFILQKEFIQIFRNKIMLPIIFVMPILQLVILAYAATFEIKNISMYVVDNDLSTTSRQLTNKFKASPFFVIKEQSFSLKEAENALKENAADIILYIPSGFEKKLYKENESKIQVIANAINGTVAGIASSYTSAIIMAYNKQIIYEWFSISDKQKIGTQINVSTSFWYNKDLNYQVFMVPGILAILVTLIGMFLSGLNMVREKEIGTIEQINVTPIRKYEFIIGKLLPFWILGLIELAIGLIIGRLLFSVPFLGSFTVLFSSAAIYLLGVLGLGLLVSAVSHNQQQLMFVLFFFILIFEMMGGIFTPTESMPEWAQWLNTINPMYYFMRIIRMILLKGSGFIDIANELFSLSIYAIVVLFLAIWKYRKIS